MNPKPKDETIIIATISATWEVIRSEDPPRQNTQQAKKAITNKIAPKIEQKREKLKFFIIRTDKNI